MKNLEEDMTDLEKERIASGILKKKMEEGAKNEDGEVEVRMRTRGRPALFTVKQGKIRRKRKMSFACELERMMYACYLCLIQ